MGWWQGCCRAQLLLGLLERGPCLDWSLLGHSPPQELRWGEWFSSPAGAFEQRDHEVEPLASPAGMRARGGSAVGGSGLLKAVPLDSLGRLQGISMSDLSSVFQKCVL